MNTSPHRSTAVRWASLAAKIAAGVAAVALIVPVALFVYVANDVGDVFSAARMSGKVKDASARGTSTPTW